MLRPAQVMMVVLAGAAACADSDGSLPEDPDARPLTDAHREPDGPDPADAGAGDAAPPVPVINEFVANHVGSPDAMEYIEVRGQASTDYSAYTLLVLEGDYSASMPTIRGGIDRVLPVGSTDGSGYWDTGLRTDYIENGSLTILLVDGFASSPGVDLDTDDDGVLDLEPWTLIADAVAVDDGQIDNRTYGAPALTIDFDGAGLAVGGASRMPDGADTGAAGDFTRNDFDLDGADSGEAQNTRGAANAVVP